MILDGYVRVSRVAGRRGASFISPAVQREQIERWARLRGAVLGEIFEELDESGARSDRPLLLEAIRRVEQGESEGLVVAHLSRFGRSLTDGLVAIKRITEAGGAFVSVKEDIDFSTDTGRLLLRLLLSIAEWELDRYRENWRVASERALMRGVFMGAVPLGYTRGKGGGLRVHPKQGPIVTELFRRRADGALFSELTRYLEESGIEPPRTDRWYRERVPSLIRKRVYLGEASYRGLVNPGAHQALIDPETWERAQFRGIRSPRVRYPTAPLWGLLRCASCQRLLTTGARSVGTSLAGRDYRCNGHLTRAGCPSLAYIADRAVEPYVERIFWQELPKLSRARKPARVVRLQAILDRRMQELHTYRDNPRLPVILGARFDDGVAVRARRVELAGLELARAARKASVPDLPDPAELRESWHSLTVDARRSAIGQVIDCVFVRSGHGPVEERTHVFLRGRAPVGLPALGERCDPLPPFDSTEFPPKVRLRRTPECDMAHLRAELERFTAGRDHWPSFIEFQHAGRALLYADACRHGGVRKWARTLGVPFAGLARRWSDDEIRAGLSEALVGRTHWMSHKEFSRAGYGEVRRAVTEAGGAARWAREMGVTLSPRHQTISAPWTYAHMKAEVARVAGIEKRWPREAQFRAAGLRGLSQTIARRGLRERLAADLRLVPASTWKLRHRRWTEDLIRVELDEFLNGRQVWPTAAEFADVGLGGLRARLSATGTIDWWASQYGLVVPHAKRGGSI